MIITADPRHFTRSQQARTAPTQPRLDGILSRVSARPTLRRWPGAELRHRRCLLACADIARSRGRPFFLVTATSYMSWSGITAESSPGTTPGGLEPTADGLP